MHTLKKLLVALLLGASAGPLRAAVSETNSFNVSLPIPDGIASGLHEVRTISSQIAFISSVRVRLNISGNFNGDLYGYLRHSSGLTVLLNRSGRASTNLYGYNDAGFNVTLADSATNDIHNYRATVTPGAGLPLTGTWQPDARYVHPGSVTGASTRSAFLSAFNGLNANGAWTLFLADVDPGGTNFLNSWTLEITGNPKITPVVIWPTPAAITYATALSSTQLNASANVPGTFAYTPPAGSVLNAGSNQVLSVTFTPLDTTNYAAVTTNVSLTVLKKALTITADDQTKVYGAPLPVFTASYAGFVAGEGPSNLSTPVTFSTTATANSPTNTYPITPGGATAQNYAITFVGGTLTVTPAGLSVTVDNASRVYGAPEPGFTGTIVGLQNNDNITATYVATATTTSPVGNYHIVPALSDPNGRLPNYNLSVVNGTLTIGPATLTGTANNKSRLYGQTNPVFTVTHTGFANGEDSSIVTGTLTGSTTADTNSPVGVYPISVSGQSAPNYTIQYLDGTLTVHLAPLVIAADNANRAYGQLNPHFTATFSGFVNGEDTNVLNGALVLSTTADTNSPVGTYPIEVAGLESTNYAIVFSNGTLTVTAHGLVVSADNQSRTYGAANPTVTGTLVGVQNGDNITANYSTTADTNSPTGSYSIVPSLNDPDSKLSNYVVTTNNGTLTITAASFTVSADDQSRAYGATNPPLTGTLAGVQNADNITAHYSTAADTNSPVGSYLIVPSLNDPGNKLANYTVTTTNGMLTVSPAALIVTADDKTKAYGEALPNLTVSFAGFVLGEDTNNLTTLPSLSTTATAASDAGTYAVTASGASATNYTFSYVAGRLTVTQSLTSATLVSSTNPAPPGASVTFTMSIAAVAPGAGTPGGAVTFRVDGGAAGSAALSNGAASFTLDTLTPGAHIVVVEYAGEANFAGVTNTLDPAQVITTSFYAGPDTIARYAAQGVKVRAATLLANDFSSDTNVFTLDSVSSTSAAGGTISVREGWIFYEPPPGFTNADSFTYVISGGAGLLSTGIVSVVIQSDNEGAENLVSVESPGGGSSRIHFQGIPGRTYLIQYAENLGAPEWTTLGTATADESGAFDYVDTPPPASAARFYRSIYQIP